ncbi:hypothetical protein [Raoultella planticola]|uniref:hypothetical protein n=1 Tax=Raoultella planticola TaxID=575 RepID=UPI003850A578
MRKILCNATAYQLMTKVREEGLDKAYDWFMELSKTENLNPREQMHIVLLAGGIRESVEQGFKNSVEVPWTWNAPKVNVIADEANIIHGTKELPKQKRTKRQPSSKCLDDARKALGRYPYNEGTNYLVGDGYFSRSCRDKYGDRMWDEACEIVRKER